MQTNLEEKIAIVTGGSRGIGRIYARGAAVLVADLGSSN
jgi:NAD(P)-dependent dehydrogenase (short-subunit alcohol dehydrogenase family)